jgi:membrane associated rhomboid family serine protease
VFLGYFVTTVTIPAIIVLGFWFFIQFLGVGSAGNQQGGGVAYWAHIGGFIAGMLLILLLGGKKLARRQRDYSSYYRESRYER